jgi:hypothetical protein
LGGQNYWGFKNKMKTTKGKPEKILFEETQYPFGMKMEGPLRAKSMVLY